MEKQKKDYDSYFTSIFSIYKKHFIASKIHKISFDTINNKKTKKNNSLINFIKEIKHPYLFGWGLITYNLTNLTAILKYFNLIKENTFGFGETLENVLKTRSMKDFSLRNLSKFFSSAFFKINSLIFSPGILAPKTFIYFSGLFNFYVNQRSTFSDYAYLFFTSCILSIPFYYQMDGFLINKLKLSRIEPNNPSLKNMYKNRLIFCSSYAFIDNFLLNLIFFGTIDLLNKFNEDKGIGLTYDKSKLNEIKNIVSDNETLERVLTLNPYFIKNNYVSDRIYENLFAGLITIIIYSPIETFLFMLRKNLFDKKLFMKNLNILNDEGKSIMGVLFKKNMRMNVFKVFIANSLNSLLLVKTIEKN